MNIFQPQYPTTRKQRRPQEDLDAAQAQGQLLPAQYVDPIKLQKNFKLAPVEHPDTTPMTAVRDRECSFWVRKATSEDGQGILDCLRAAFDQYRSEYTPGAFTDTVPDSDTIHERLHTMSVFLALSQGKVIGTIGCSVNGAEGHLRGMAVSPDRQGCGVAEALLARAEMELRNQGCQYVTLDTTEPLKRAIRFYQKHGFTPTGRVSAFFGMNLFEYKKTL